MSFPPGFLDDIKSRVSLAQVAGKKVSWDNRKSNPGKGDYWAPCPFHQEKTPSFHVDDRKGFYYCFGCHEKGDVVGFTMATDNLSFIEAVEQLAGEAGLEMPARDPQAQAKADIRTRLVAVMEAANSFFRLQLKTTPAAPARAYLEKRGLTQDHLDRFEVGFAPDGRTTLTDHLKSKGLAEADIIDAGLAIKPDDGGAPFDRFRNRITFPIRDPQARAIAFGGRAMDPDARAKYLNSPETPLFDKGRTLYNFAPAREASGKSGTLIVAEGYMDVIALVTHGFEATVAPNGTAVTPEQLRLMWRIADEPIIALDGDTAGLRAANRLIDLALPLLEPGKSLRFCILPDGLDPDDLLRQQGSGAMQSALNASRSLIDMMWQREVAKSPLDTPERRAAFDRNLKELLRQIAEPSVRAHYEAEVRQRRRDLLAPRPGPARAYSGTGKRPIRPANALPDTRQSMLASAGPSVAVDARIRESLIVALCYTHPNLAITYETELEAVEFTAPDLAAIRDAIIAHAPETTGPQAEATLKDRIDLEIGSAPLEKLMSAGHVRANPLTLPGSDPMKAEVALLDDIARHRAILGHHAEVRDAQSEITGDTDDEGITWRLKEAADARHNSSRSKTEGDTLDAEKTKELSSYLQKLIDEQSWIKK